MAIRISTSGAISGRNQSVFPRIFIFIFFGIFFLAGLFFLYHATLKPTLNYLSARNWVETPCTVISSKVLSSYSDGSSTYRPHIEYQYVFDKVSYRSQQYDAFGSWYSSGRSGKQAIVDRYPPGSTSICYVNPFDPNRAILNRNYSWQILWGIIPMVFILVGGGGMYGACFSKNLNGSTRSSISSNARSSQPNQVLPVPPVGDGPLTIKSQSKPLTGFLVLLLFSVLWNGFVGFTTKTTTDSGWFLLGLAPFWVVGILLIGFTIHQLLAIFNPRVTIHLSSNHFVPGSSATAQWEFRGNVNRIRKLRISLQGREVATYRQGTDTRTDEKTFTNVTLVAMDRASLRSDMSRGEFSIKIPDNAMHSFDARFNKIIWSIKLDGEIPYWTDVNETMIIPVYPKSIVA